MIKIVYKGGGESLALSWEEAEELGKGCARFCLMYCKKPVNKTFEFCIIDFDKMQSTIYRYEKEKGKLVRTIF